MRQRVKPDAIGREIPNTAADAPPTVRCQRGVSHLRDAPGAPLGATLPAGAHPEQVVGVWVEVKDQELTVPPNVGVLILAPPGVGPPILQPVVRCCELLVHLVAVRIENCVNVLQVDISAFLLLYHAPC